MQIIAVNSTRISLRPCLNLFLKFLNMLQKCHLIALDLGLFMLVCLFEDLVADVLVTHFVSDVHVSTPHWKTEVLFLLLCFLDGGLFRELLKLFQPFFIFLVFFLNLVSDKTHILARPNDRKLVRSRSGACQNISLLNFLLLRRPLNLLKAAGLELAQISGGSERASLMLRLGERITRVGSLSRHRSLLAAEIVFICFSHVRCTTRASYRLSFLGWCGTCRRSSSLKMVSAGVRREVARVR